MPDITYRKILLIALIVGIVSGVGSLLFYAGLQAAILAVATLLGYHMPAEGQAIAEIARWSPPASLLPLVVVLCLGGLLCGLTASPVSLPPDISGTRGYGLRCRPP